MKQLFLNKRIRDIAQKYADNLFADKRSSFVKPIDGLKNLQIDLMEINDGLEGKEDFIAYLEKIIEDFDELKALLPSKFSSYKNQFDDLLNPTRLSSRIRCRQSKLPDTKEDRISLETRSVEFYTEIVERMHYEDARTYLAPYLEELGINTCVYCNKAPAVSSKELKEAYFHFDHWLPKSQYPFLCICFYNLYPCCANCNGHKLDGSKGSFRLYAESEPCYDPFVFTIDRSKYQEMKPDSLSVHFEARKPADEDFKAEYDEKYRIGPQYNDSASLRECEKLIFDINKARCSYPIATARSVPGIVDKKELFHFTLGIDEDETNIFTDSKKKLKLDTAYDAGLLSF